MVIIYFPSLPEGTHCRVGSRSVCLPHASKVMRACVCVVSWFSAQEAWHRICAWWLETFARRSSFMLELEKRTAPFQLPEVGRNCCGDFYFAITHRSATYGTQKKNRAATKGERENHLPKEYVRSVPVVRREKWENIVLKINRIV